MNTSSGAYLSIATSTTLRILSKKSAFALANFASVNTRVMACGYVLFCATAFAAFAEESVFVQDYVSEMQVLHAVFVQYARSDQRASQSRAEGEHHVASFRVARVVFCDCRRGSVVYYRSRQGESVFYVAAEIVTREAGQSVGRISHLAAVPVDRACGGNGNAFASVLMHERSYRRMNVGAYLLKAFCGFGRHK